MDRVPTLRGDSSLAFLADGYAFGHRRFEAHKTDAFRSRLMGRRVLLLRGSAAAHFFYDAENFTRDGAMPRSVLHSLQDEGSVQTLSGRAHHARKALFVAALDREGENLLTDLFAKRWDAAAALRGDGDLVRVLEASAGVLMRAVLDWLGLPSTAREVSARTHEMTAMIDGAGSFAWRNWRGRTLRRRSEAWARRVVCEARSAAPSSLSRPLALIVDPGTGLDDDTAATELLNMVRPTVAVARFVAFAALALHRHPVWRDRVAAEPAAATAFAEEVRRTTPLFPVIGGTAAKDIRWGDLRIREGGWVMLDLFATDRHPGEWFDGGRFDPARHLAEAGRSPVDPADHLSGPHVVAQGDGAMTAGHRCPGEPATRSILSVAVERLAAAEWSVPTHNLRVDLSRLPARPGKPGITILWRRA
jgi:fatty-acid peroxygenase